MNTIRLFLFTVLLFTDIAISAANLVNDGTFDEATSTTWYGNAYNPVNGVNQADIGAAGNPWDVNLSGYVNVVAGVDYTLSFDVTGADRTIVAGIGQSVSPYLVHTDTVTVSAITQTIVMHLTAKADGTGEDFGGDRTRVIFDMGADTGAVSIDNVSLIAGHTGTVNLGTAGPEPEPEPTGVNLVLTTDGAAVRLTGPSWSWYPNGGPEASDNGDGTWTVTLYPTPTDNMEYLWVVDGVQENLIDNAANAECAADIDGGSLITDYANYANRVCVVDSGDAVYDTYDSCAGTKPCNYCASS